MATIDELRARAELISEEQQIGGNTAERVGEAFDMVADIEEALDERVQDLEGVVGGRVVTYDPQTPTTDEQAQARENINAQEAIADLSEIRAGAQAGATAYQKPLGGIPINHLNSALREKITRADVAEVIGFRYVQGSVSFYEVNPDGTFGNSTYDPTDAIVAHFHNIALYDITNNLFYFPLSFDVSGVVKRYKYFRLDSSMTFGFIELIRTSTAPITSAYVAANVPMYTKAQVDSLLSSIDTALNTIEAVIPSAASSTNKLTDKAYVDGAIATNTANFVGTFETLEELQAVQNPTKNDYGFVIETDAQGNEYYDRYKYTGSQWLFEYKVESTPFTADQWAAIQSGITAALVTKLSALPTAAEITTALAGKQDTIADLDSIRSGAAAGAAAAPQATTYTKAETDSLLAQKQGTLTFDSTPTAGSTNPVKSSGIYSALQNKQDSADIATINGSDITHGGNVTIVAAEGQTITIDAAPTEGSSNAVSSGGVYPLQKAHEDLVTTNPIVEHNPKNWLDFNSTDFVTGKFITSTGALGNGSNYKTSGYIPVKQGETYKIVFFNTEGTAIQTRPYFSYGINEYDANKSLIRTLYNASGRASYTPSEDAVYMRCSSSGFGDGRTVLFYGDDPSVFSAYFAPYTTGGDCILKDDVIVGKNIQSDTIPNAKIKKAAVNPRFHGFKVSGALAASESIETLRINTKKDYTITAVIEGSIGSVRIGLDVEPAWVEITPTSLVRHFNGVTDETMAHGLTLGVRTTIAIIKRGLYSTTSNVTVKIYDDFGNSFETDIYYWYNVSGRAYLTNNGNGEINAMLTFQPMDLLDKVWIFGDSYISDSGHRWTNVLYKLGYKSWLINGRGGQSGSDGLTDLENLLSLGAAPTFILWCYGMNQGADSNGGVNSTWLTQENEFLQICEDNDIVPVLATIPSVPSQIHTALNAWVRNSGYAYIDFAAAVEDSSDNRNLWRGWGSNDSTPSDDALLSSDKVHPSDKGSIILALKALQDCPQIAVSD